MKKVRVVEEAPVHVIVDSMPAGGSGLTDNELRATPVPVEFDAAQHVIVDSMPAGGSGLTDAELRASPVVVDLGANNDVTIASLPLPTGAATAALQLPNSHDVTIDNAAGGSAVNIQDGGNSITVDGTFWQATQPVSGTVTVTDGSGSLTVDGSVTANPSRPATATLSNVSGSASSVTLLASNANRLGGMIWNDSSAILYVKFGTTASTTSCTVKMIADAYFEIPFWYTGRIDGIWASATGNARITELTA